MAAADHEHPTEGHVLADHEAEFGNLGVAEVIAKFADEAFVDTAEVGCELLGEANGEVFPRLERPLAFGLVDLGDRLFIESLLRSLRIPGEESGIALVHGRDLDSRDLLDARRGHAFGVAGPEEGEEALEQIGQLLHHVQRAAVPGVRCGSRGRDFLCAHPASSRSRFMRDRLLRKA